MLLWLDAYITGWLSGFISMSRRRVPTSFLQWPSRPLWGLLFKKANHFTMTTLNIRSDPMATWECAKQVQASPQLLGKRNACALHFRELKKNSHRSRRCTSAVCWKFDINVMQKSSKLELFYQIVKIHEFLKYARKSRASKALPLDDLSGAVSAYYQRRTEPVVLDTI